MAQDKYGTVMGQASALPGVMGGLPNDPEAIRRYRELFESIQQAQSNQAPATPKDAIETVINQIDRDARRRQAAKEVLETLMAHANIAVFADVETNTIYKNAIAAAVESVRKSL